MFLFCSMLSLSDVRSSCRIVPGLSKKQLELCYRANDVTSSALDGLDLAIRECQTQVNFSFCFVNEIVCCKINECFFFCCFQFQWNRWNCSALANKKRNPYLSIFLKKGEYCSQFHNNDLFTSND